jgi:hypothetical protein
MLRLHYFSNLVALQLADQDEEVYRLDQIKEFETVDPALKEVLAEYLLQGIYAALFCTTSWNISDFRSFAEGQNVTSVNNLMTSWWMFLFLLGV